jgi:KDO2-lipid IV(A) lauroyltransferase
MEFVRAPRGRNTGVSVSFPPEQLLFRLIRAACHFFSDLFYLTFVYLWPYRRKVILRNVENAFPHYSDSDKRRFLRKYYRHLADLITEFPLIHGCPEQELHALVRYENVTLLRDLLKAGKDVVLMAAHCGNWEYLRSLPLYVDAEVFAAYAPVSPPFLNDKLKNMRARFGIQLIPKKDWYRQVLKRTSASPAIFISVTDQRPAGPGSLNLLFLNQKTAFQSGAAQIALKRSAAVVYVDVVKTDRNAYTFRFEMLSQNPHSSCVSDLNLAYYHHLEKTIRRQPELWLWSHNRWKY